MVAIRSCQASLVLPWDLAKVKLKNPAGGHATEHGRGLSEVNLLSQHVAAKGKVQKTLLLLVPQVFTA